MAGKWQAGGQNGGIASQGKRAISEGPSFIKRLISIRHVRLGLMAAVAVAIGAGGWAVILGPAHGCKRTAARKAAVRLLTELTDPVSGDPLSRRFPRGDFRCGDLNPATSNVAGIIVEARDGSDPVTWYFDASGTPHNVNQLAAAWTPKFEPAPRLSPDQLAVVRR